MNTSPTINSDTFDPEQADDIIGIAKGLVNGLHPGILCTVDRDGNPRARWMSTLTFEGFPIFYTLTAPHSRKVLEINDHPEVNWMFANADKTLVLNLIGKARVQDDAQICKRIWKKAVDKSHPYFLDQFGKTERFVVIETTVETIECTSPQSSLRFNIAPAELKRV